MKNKITKLDEKINNLMNSKKYHIFHHNDMDGHSSGALIGIGLNELGVIRENIYFYEIDYGMPFDDSNIDYNNDTVYLVDFFIQPDQKMWELKNKLENRFIWIDHHRTSLKFIKEGFPLKGIIEDGPKAACELVWEWFWPKREKPAALKMISQYDVWNKEGDFSWVDCLYLKYGLETLDTLPKNALDFWSSLMFCSKKIKEEKLNALLEKGKLLKDFNDKKEKANTEQNAYEGIFDGKNAIILNSPQKGSNQFEVAYDTSKYDIMVTYRNTQGKYWKIGLYSTNPDINCGDIARRIGHEGPLKSGGGHPGAAGFQTDTAHMMKIMPGFEN